MFVITVHGTDTIYGPFLSEESARMEFETIDKVVELDGEEVRTGPDRYTIVELSDPRDGLTTTQRP